MFSNKMTIWQALLKHLDSLYLYLKKRLKRRTSFKQCLDIFSPPPPPPPLCIVWLLISGLPMFPSKLFCSDFFSKSKWFFFKSVKDFFFKSVLFDIETNYIYLITSLNAHVPCHIFYFVASIFYFVKSWLFCNA